MFGGAAVAPPLANHTTPRVDDEQITKEAQPTPPHRVWPTRQKSIRRRPTTDSQRADYCNSCQENFHDCQFHKYLPLRNPPLNLKMPEGENFADSYPRGIGSGATYCLEQITGCTGCRNASGIEMETSGSVRVLLVPVKVDYT